MKPEIVTTCSEVRARVRQARAADQSIGFVPTMGALHGGHLALIRLGRAECDYVVVSIFVNPTQFAPDEDLARYPRDLGSDARKCGEAGVDLIFAPSVEEVYPPGDATFVEVTGPLVEGMCAPHRPGHFRGVTTVCARLFHTVGADRAYFGEKDYQQLQVIRQMVRDLKLPLDIVPVPTVREPDGLAMSSRNAYLSAEERGAAAVLYRALSAARHLSHEGEREATALLAAAREVIEAEPMARLQYLEVRDAETLANLTRIGGPAVLAVAAFVGKTRLMDNVVVAE